MRTFVVLLVIASLMVPAVVFHDDVVAGITAALSHPGVLAAVCAWRAVPIALNAESWRLLVIPAQRPPLRVMVLLRWIGESVNSVLPWSQVGGDVVRARLLWLRGVGGAEATAAMVADLAVSFGTQIVFTLLGVGALVLVSDAGHVWRPIAFAGAGLIVVIAAIWALRRFGVERPVRWLTRRWSHHERVAALAGGAAAVDERLDEVLGRRRDVALASLWHLAAWLSHIGETWLILRGLGHPVDVPTALALESLGFAARTAAFVLPGGLGAQEAALVVLATQLGCPTDVAVGLATLKRLREVVVGLPGLVTWGLLERHADRPQEGTS